MTSFSNNASGQARVGTQIGSIRGNYSVKGDTSTGDVVGDNSDDLAGRLNEIESIVKDLHRSGTIDAEDARLASEDIASARELLPIDRKKDTNRLLAHLRRVQGLVTGSAALTSSVAAAIAAVQDVI